MIKKQMRNEELKFSTKPLETVISQIPTVEKKTHNIQSASSKKNTTTTATSNIATKKLLLTRIIIKFNTGFGNSLFIRGNGSHLNWEKGIALKNNKTDEWVWETEVPFTTCEFKILLNDKCYELGTNHIISCGTTIQYTPKF